MASQRSRRAPPAPKGQTYMFLMMLLMVFILIDPRLTGALGAGMSFLLNPAIGFGGNLPVASVFFAGALTGVLSTGLRHWSSDYIALERGRLLQKNYQKEMSDARLKRDVDRVERLRRAQPFIMSHTMEANYATMRPAIGTMVVALAVFGWLSVFLSQTVLVTHIALPWTAAWPLHGAFGFPYWVVLYMVMSLPLSVCLSAGLKLWRFRNFDPGAPLKPVPTVDDLVRRAEGETDDEETIAAESDRARRRLRGGPAVKAKVAREADTVIVDADEEAVEIVDAEEGEEGAGEGDGEGEPDGGDEAEAGGEAEDQGPTGGQGPDARTARVTHGQGSRSRRP